MPWKDKNRRREYMRKWRAENRAWWLNYRPKQYEASRRWRRNNKEKRLAWLREWMEKNRKILTEKHRSWIAANPQARRRIWNRWYRANVETWNLAVKNRRLKRVGVVSKSDWESIKAKYDNRCAYCKLPDQKLTQDHFIPLAKGGLHTPENIVPACQSCNSRKRDTPGVLFIHKIDPEP